MAVYTFEWKYRKGGGQPEVKIFPEAASQTYKAGAPLVFDTSDEAVKLATVTTVSFIGIALKDATGTTGKDAPVLIPTPLDVFTATISASGANLAAAHDKNNIGVKYGWIASTVAGQTTKYTIDEDNTTNNWILPIGVYTDVDEPEGTAGGRLYFQFLTTPLEDPNVA